jgi:peptidoglycan/xylan/chitin deacetylase (PgdA/CDA1 family)
MRSSISALIARKIGGFMRTRPADVHWPGGIASFTFDDFPRSALTVGGAILERHDGRGTYYTAMRFAGGGNHLGAMFDLADLAAAHRAGHEIACHTHDHLDCRYADRATITAEIEKNAQAIVDVLDTAAPTNFAYPYGAVSLTAKRVLAHHFVTCRGTGEGINAGKADLADLRVVTLYAHRFDEVALRARIDEARDRNGWVIFYTHDVSEDPSEWGCTPAQLEAVVGHAAQRLPILPVREVAARVVGDLQRSVAA